VQNSGRLREAIREGRPIRDVTAQKHGPNQIQYGLSESREEPSEEPGLEVRRQRLLVSSEPIEREATMLRFEPGPDRSKLGSKEAVLASFKFLRNHGFDCVSAEPTFVRYERRRPPSERKLFVNVYHGRGSYELGVEIGPSDQERETISLPEIVKWAGAENAEKTEEFGRHVMFQVSSAEGVQKFVPKLAYLVQKYAAPFLEGDPEAYRAVLEERQRASVRYLNEDRLGEAREKAEAAWHVKDYTQVVN
jgi:hypothetical protein